MCNAKKIDGILALNVVVMFVNIVSIIWLFTSCSPLVNAELEKVAVEIIDDIPELIHEETGIETQKTN